MYYDDDKIHTCGCWTGLIIFIVHVLFILIYETSITQALCIVLIFIITCYIIGLINRYIKLTALKYIEHNYVFFFQKKCEEIDRIEFKELKSNITYLESFLGDEYVISRDEEWELEEID